MRDIFEFDTKKVMKEAQKESGNVVEQNYNHLEVGRRSETEISSNTICSDWYKCALELVAIADYDKYE